MGCWCYLAKWAFYCDVCWRNDQRVCGFVCRREQVGLFVMVKANDTNTSFQIPCSVYRYIPVLTCAYLYDLTVRLDCSLGIVGQCYIEGCGEGGGAWAGRRTFDPLRGTSVLYCTQEQEKTPVIAATCAPGDDLPWYFIISALYRPVWWIVIIRARNASRSMCA